MWHEVNGVATPGRSNPSSFSFNLGCILLGIQKEEKSREKTSMISNYHPGPIFIELLKHKKHNKSMLTRIRLPAKLRCHVHNMWLVSCSLLLSRTLLSNIFCLSNSTKLGPAVLRTTEVGLINFKITSTMMLLQIFFLVWFKNWAGHYNFTTCDHGLWKAPGSVI